MKRIAVILGVAACWLAGPLIFLLRECHQGLSGFPLDDSWIHQTYARALAGGQGWSYAGGSQSAGSTSPAWTLLQVPAYWLHISPVVWSSVLGILLLMANALFVYAWVRTIHPKAAVYAMLFVLGEWHLIWAGLSGMETLLFATWISAMLCVFFAYIPYRTPIHAFLFFCFGIFLGMGAWIRPEAVLFSFLAILSFFLYMRKKGIRPPLMLGLGAAAALFSYFIFEYHLHGLPWPNTFYAKPAEYLALTGQSILTRLIQPWIPLLAGPLAVLWIFLIPCIYYLAQKRLWYHFWPLAGCLLHILVFSLQLPAFYQHGRYFIPLLPILLGYAVSGSFLLAEKVDGILLPRILSRAGWASALLLLGIFLWIGAGRFTTDVDIIESEMVFSSRWIQAHTPVDAVVAAHDIGALGFWGKRRIVDLGGLTDLDSIKLLEGGVSLKDYLKNKQADYLMTFPVFYTDALHDCDPLMQTANPAQVETPGVVMTVYEWKNGCLTSASR